MTWVPLLRVLNPSSAYVRRVQQGRGSALAEERDGPGERDRSATEPPETSVTTHRLGHQRRGLADSEDSVLRGAARQALSDGRTRVADDEVVVEARLVKFWNGSAILDARRVGDSRSGGGTFSLIDRRELRHDAEAMLAVHLLHALGNHRSP